MTDLESRFSRLIQELRNRRVFRVSAVYLAIGFALLEAVDIIVPTMGFPPITVKVILILLVLGFPLAITFAWMFQMTPDGIRRSPKSGEKQTTQQKPLTSNIIIIGLLIIIAGLLTYPRFSDANPETPTASMNVSLDSKSIAVLPFTPFTKTVEDESFADGVHDDILTQLSKIGELKVISRTSVMQY